jgi:hypothetical protein
MKFITYNKQDERWSRVNGKPGVVDVPNVFAQVLYNYRDTIDLHTIEHAIELGTFEGDTATIFAEHFGRVSTVEQYITNNSYTSIDLLERYTALKKQCNNIDFYNADSASFLKDILSKHPDERFVMLLDAHTPTQSPVISEFEAIRKYSNRNDHVIIVDDCVDIGGPGWPTMDQFINGVKSMNIKYTAEDTNLGRRIIIIYEPA